MAMSLKILTGVVLGFLCAHSADAGEAMRTVNEGGIRDQWTLADGMKLATPEYPATFAKRGDNVCIALGYQINSDGTTSNFALLKAWTSSSGPNEPEADFWSSFAQSGADALAQWRFKPRPDITNPVSTYTVATMIFMGKKGENGVGLRSQCAIADLSATLKKLKSQRSKANRFDDDLLQKQQKDQMNRIIRSRQ